MNRLQLELADGTYVGLTYLTTGEYLSAWAELVAGDGSIRPTTAKNYDVAVRVHIVPTLGTVPLQQLTRRMIQGLYQVLRDSGRARGVPGGLSPKSVYNVHLTLHRALEDAVADGLLHYNPSARAHRCTAPATRMRVWSSTELRAFLASVEDEPWFALWRLAATTGMRRGELLGLCWRDVDLDRERLNIRRQLQGSGRATRFAPPKTEAGRRCIALDPITVEALRQHKSRHSVTWSTGHAHATLALQAGVHPKVVQERLGHASVKVTLDTYSHVLPPMHQEAAARVAAPIDVA